jgi:hypothetical protein
MSNHRADIQPASFSPGAPASANRRDIAAAPSGQGRPVPMATVHQHRATVPSEVHDNVNGAYFCW